MLAEIRERGEPVTLDELQAWYEAQADGAKAAALYWQAFDAYYNYGNVAVLTDQEAAALPLVGDAEFENGEALPASTLAAIQDYLEKNQMALDLLDQASREEDCVFPLDFTRSFQVDLPHLLRLRHAVRLQALQAYVAAELGDAAAAQEAILRGLRIASSLENEPVMISQLFRGVSTQICTATLERSLSRMAFSKRQLDSMTHAFRQSVDERAWYFSQIEETCFIIHEIRQAGNSGIFMGGDVRFILLRYEMGLNAFPASRNWLFQYDLHRYLKTMEEAIQVFESGFPDCLDEFERINKALSKDIHLCPGTRYLCPAILRAPADFASAIASSRMAVAGIALAEYRQAKGTWPDTLGELVPAYLDELPEDPYDGRPIRYRATGDGFLMYSVSKNRWDNGGIETQDKDQGDLLFEVTVRVD